MKTLHFVSILVLAAATTFACDDDGDRVEAGAAGKTGTAGTAGKTGTAGSAGKSGAAGSSAGSPSDAGAGGGDAGSNEGGMAGLAGSNEGGQAGGGGAAGEASDAGAAGRAGAAGMAGGGGEGGAPEVPDVVVPGPTALIGTWDTNFGGTEIITATTWSGANIVAYTSGVSVVYTHNPASDPYNPRKFSKFVYTEPVADSFYFCQIVYNADTLAAAQADTTVTDATDPDNAGCSGFSWTKATRH